MSADFVPELLPRRRHVVVPGRKPLDEMTAAEVEPIVERVVQTRLDEQRITAAKFSSFI